MAKLLFITQRVDKDDSVLGVYHRWLEELSKKLPSIVVICLYKGHSELPNNVRVLSLGKETGQNRAKYIYRFYKYIWGLRRDYETVFVHMNPIYIILGGWFWKLYGKKIFLWYNHPLGNITAKLGILLADKVFCTSPYSFSAKFKKTSLMPVGIDTNLFRPMPEIQKNDKQILYLGRISPIKKIEHLIEAAKILDDQGLDFKILIVGSPGSSSDGEYESKLKKMSVDLSAKGKVEFRPAVPNHKAPEVYNASGIFVNLTPTGSLDKTTFEAMACGLPILASNKIFRSLLLEAIGNFCVFRENNPQDLSKKISFLLLLDNSAMRDIGKQGRELIVINHGLANLIDNLVVIFDNNSTG